MRKRNYFLLALASMAFAACSNDDFVADVDNGIITEPTGDAWVALNVRPPSLASTRGLHVPDHENGTPAETEIKSVRAIFFTSGASPTVTADIELTLSQAGANASGQPTGNAGEAFKVPAASKRVLIVANASKEFKDRAPSGWSGGTPYATVNDALVLSTGNGVLSFTDGFMMSNAKGGLEPSKTEEPGLGDPVDLTLYKNATGAVANPLVINIDRVVAIRPVVSVRRSTSIKKVLIEKTLIMTLRIPEWIILTLLPTPVLGMYRTPVNTVLKIPRIKQEMYMLIPPTYC